MDDKKLIDNVILGRAQFTPTTLDETTRTVEVTFATEARISRRAWDSEEYSYRDVVEILDCKPNSVRLERFQNGAPVLDNHDRYSGTKGVLGVVEDPKIVAGQGVAKIRFSKSEDGERAFNGVKDGILRTVSIGYLVHEYQIIKKDGQPDEYRAMDWEPMELSLAPIPADYMAQIRAKNDMAPIGQHAEKVSPKNFRKMEENQTGAVQTPNPPVVDVDNIRAQAVIEERKRTNEIQTAAKIAGLDTEFVTRHIEAGTSPDTFRALALEQMAAAQVTIDNKQTGSVRGDESEMNREALEAGILLRGGYASINPKFAEIGGKHRNDTLVDIAKLCIEKDGVSTRGWSAHEIINRAITSSTSDFPVILSSVVNTVLLDAYATTDYTWNQFCSIGTLSDFRVHTRIREDALGNLQTVPENGEFKRLSIADGRPETIIGSTKGAIINISRQMMINDALGSFLRLATRMGQAASRSIELDVYALLAQNSGFGPNMSDGNTLFHATHNNLGTGSALGVAGLDADRVVMASQTDGQDYLDLRPSVLLVPIGLGSAARVYNLSQYNPDASNKLQAPNVVAGLFNQVVDSPRILGTVRYLFADPNLYPTIEVAFLNGVSTPFLETDNGFEVDGMRIKVRHDYGVGAVGFKGAVRNAGA
jgi:hypothetical protein